ncbi:MAG: TetR/AcrR family transcriptional regulator [Nonomuraea sp.]|nr:TetR/AcrR family transcriptional regulator [Nonomuraea sp.]
MPRLWNATIEAHRREVREAILDSTAAMAAERGPWSITMSQVAEKVGIGRATLYKYFPDVESILIAWHEDRIDAHLKLLEQARDQARGPADRLRAVLETYAGITHETRSRHHGDLSALLHGDGQVEHARHRLHALVKDLIAAGADAGVVRADVTPGELATYCLHALSAAGHLPSKAAVRRLVTVTMTGLR